MIGLFLIGLFFITCLQIMWHSKIIKSYDIANTILQEKSYNIANNLAQYTINIICLQMWYSKIISTIITRLINFLCRLSNVLKTFFINYRYSLLYIEWEYMEGNIWNNFYVVIWEGIIFSISIISIIEHNCQSNIL